MAGKEPSRKILAWCTRHCRRCIVKQNDVLAGGTSCKDYSPAGKRAGVLGNNLAATLAFFRMVKRCRLALHENVPLFPALAEVFLKDSHAVHKFIVKPSHGGFKRIQNRARAYRMCIGKGCRMVADPQKVFRAVIKKFRPLNKRAKLQHLIRANREEIQKALSVKCKCEEICTCTFQAQLTPAQDGRSQLYIYIYVCSLS